MQNTITTALFLMIVTGMLFTGCSKDEAVTGATDGNGQLEESVMGELEEDDDDTNEGQTSASHETTNSAATDTGSGATVSGAGTTTQTSVYKDGTYSNVGSYQSPGGTDQIGVTLVIKDEIVTAVTISEKAGDATSKIYQEKFIAGVSAMVVGKPLASIGNLGAVNGASLTPIGFNSAVAAIQTLAKL